jgi:hypothetical protein
MRTTGTSKTVRRLAGQGHLIGEPWAVSNAGGPDNHRLAGPVQSLVELGHAAPVPLRCIPTLQSMIASVLYGLSPV